MNNENLSDTIRNFLDCFPSYWIQTLDDKSTKGSDNPREQLMELIHDGPPSAFTEDQLRALNMKEAGIFFSPNRFSQRRKKELCEGVNAWYMEIDGLPKEEQMRRIQSSPLSPSIITESSNSYHCYWLAKDGTVERFEKIIRGLIQYFGADPACSDVSRVLRIPGFYHNKREPFLVNIHYADYELKYTEAEMMQHFPYTQEEYQTTARVNEPIAEGLRFWEAASQLDNKTILLRLSGTFMAKHEVITFRPRPTGGEYIDVNGEPSDAWLDERGMIGSGKKGGPTFIQWLGYYGWKKSDIAAWVKKNCSDLLPASALQEKRQKSSQTDRDPSKTQCAELLALFKKEKPLLFRSEMDEGYVQVCINGRKEILRCESRKFEKYLHWLYWKEKEDMIGSENLTKVVRLIASEAEYGSEKYHLHNRVALFEGDFWYDLGRSRAIRCTKTAWELVEELPIIFHSYQHQDEQILPITKGGDLSKIFNHISIKNEDHQLLFSIWLVSCFVPEIPHAILVLYGEKGSAKSSTLRIARGIIDPSKTDLLSLPNHDELVQQLSHHYAPFYDNVNKISQMISDTLCRATTGGGASKRRLFTDDDDMIYRFRRVIGLNGINNVVQTPDLLDRSILIELQRIPDNKRKTEDELKATFEEDRPYILGGVFDVLVQARQIFDSLTLSSFPRMADFAKWGFAIAEVLGFGGDTFIASYQANIKQQNREVLENDQVAHVICCFMEQKERWEGPPKKFYEELSRITQEMKIDSKDWPRRPADLGKRINLILSNLRDEGITIEREKDTSGKRGRSYIITKTAVAADAVVLNPPKTEAEVAQSDGSDNSDSNLGTGISMADFKSVFPNS